jgi:three-Cys-motif partner protein
LSPQQDFFSTISPQSQAKCRIVEKYFDAWSHVILPSAKIRGGKLAYIDLFAGPGRYQDDSASIPLLVLRKAIPDQDLCEKLVTIFNDINADNSNKLETEISKLSGIDKLRHKPIIHNVEVDESFAKSFEGMHLVPTLFFIDPWGFKGLSLKLVNSVLKDWGCDCIFFFNYNRINMGLTNPLVRSHVNGLLGEAAAEELRSKLVGASPSEREDAILEALIAALRVRGGKFVVPFRFKRADGDRTSHHLIFVSKHFRGYEIMKEIMAKESTSWAQGVPSFTFNPRDADQPLLIVLARPIDRLKRMLRKDLSGRGLTMRQIYEEHSNGKMFIQANYKEALRQLEAEDQVTADPPARERPKRNGIVTFADTVVVTFP